MICIVLNRIMFHVLYRESRRQEDLERELDRLECVVLNYPPVDDTNMVLNAAVEHIPTVFPFFSFLTAPGLSSQQTVAVMSITCVQIVSLLHF